MEEIKSRKSGDDRLGIFLAALHKRFDDGKIEQFLTYIELHTELVRSAEEAMLAHERGEKSLVSQETKEKLIHL